MKRPALTLAQASRRDALKFLGGAIALAGCGSAFSIAKDGGTVCEASSDETLGPYPDKTGMLTNPTYQRADITEGKAGLKLNVVLTIVDSKNACAPVAGSQVIIWQCDAEGHYSEYPGQPGGYDGTGATYLRGVQTADANGQLNFTTVYPGWYAGRATHIHVQVFVAGVSKKVTQLAFSETVTSQVYATGVYAAKGANPQNNATDTVFGDSLQEELASLTGDTVSGYVATLTVGI